MCNGEWHCGIGHWYRQLLGILGRVAKPFLFPQNNHGGEEVDEALRLKLWKSLRRNLEHVLLQCTESARGTTRVPDGGQNTWSLHMHNHWTVAWKPTSNHPIQVYSEGISKNHTDSEVSKRQMLCTQWPFQEPFFLELPTIFLRPFARPKFQGISHWFFFGFIWNVLKEFCIVPADSRKGPANGTQLVFRVSPEPATLTFLARSEWCAVKMGYMYYVPPKFVEFESGKLE